MDRGRVLARDVGQSAPGAADRRHPGLGDLSGPVMFAGSVFSGASLGYIDGAIETGLRAARAILSRS
ncbi:hypothetical protein E4L97_17250 [Aeromicrobium chenweiae]|nr:hypothetical protein E4L97_17250 [Aeromicrobium chenweiae]